GGPEAPPGAAGDTAPGPASAAETGAVGTGAVGGDRCRRREWPGGQPAEAVSARSRPNSSAIPSRLQWALSPLGLGSTHTPVSPNVRCCGPTVASRSSNAVRYAVTPTTASHRGRSCSTL